MAAALSAMEEGRCALDIVEAGVRRVESDPAIHSVGIGSRANMLGDVELDAGVMEGSQLKAGAVAALRGYVHPISVARLVMERLPHVLLAGEGAARFAMECHAEAGETLTGSSRSAWRRWWAGRVPKELRDGWPDVPLLPWALDEAQKRRGTVIFIALDREGRIAVGTSTGGLPYKYPGRVGDSPLIGAGCYADDRYGAAACIGMGEMTIRAGTARAVVLYMKMGRTVREACQEACDDLMSLRGGEMGTVAIHAVDREGRHHVLCLGKDPFKSYCLWTEESKRILNPLTNRVRR
jgi:L-asparaginase